jgi:hypothetical protein
VTSALIVRSRGPWRAYGFSRIPADVPGGITNGVRGPGLMLRLSVRIVTLNWAVSANGFITTT